MLSSTREVAKKKFRYQRSPYLTGHGLSLHFWKAALSAESRQVSLGTKAVDIANRCNIDLNDVKDLAKREIRKKV